MHVRPTKISIFPIYFCGILWGGQSSETPILLWYVHSFRCPVLVGPSHKLKLGGGNSNIFFIFTPKIGEDFVHPIFDDLRKHIFQDGLSSTSHQVGTHLHPKFCGKPFFKKRAVNQKPIKLERQVSYF